MIARLPQKRKRPRMGVQKPPQREWRRHRRFVKSHGCSIPNCPYRHDPDMPIDFAHLQTRGAGGHDCDGVSFCRIHHGEQHNKGIEYMEEKYGIDLWALAREFTRRSPDIAMKDSLKLVNAEELA